MLAAASLPRDIRAIGDILFVYKRQTVSVEVVEPRLPRNRAEPVRLPEIDCDAEHDHRHDDQRVDVLAERPGNDAFHGGSAPLFSTQQHAAWCSTSSGLASGVKGI